LAPDEEEPHRAAKSKKYITKVMFLYAVTRPRWDTRANRYFDGKIVMWPFVEQVPAQRASMFWSRVQTDGLADRVGDRRSSGFSM
jgi:hypothetical protein